MEADTAWKSSLAVAVLIGALLVGWLGTGGVATPKAQVTADPSVIASATPNPTATMTSPATISPVPATPLAATADPTPLSRPPDAMTTGPTSPPGRTFGRVAITDEWLEAHNGGSRIVEGVRFLGPVSIETDDVTIRNFRIDTSARYGVSNGVLTGQPTTGLILEDGEITGASSAAVLVSNATLRRLELHDLGSDAVKPFRDVVVEDCYIHDIGANPGSHADAFQVVDGGPLVFRGNHVDIDPTSPGYSANASFMIQTNNGPIRDVLIEGNWLDGGNYAIYVNDHGSGHGPPTEVVIRENRFGRHHQYGLLATGADPVFEDNVYDDTGEPA